VESTLEYDEPPALFFSTGHWLGEALVRVGQPHEAEQVRSFHRAGAACLRPPLHGSQLTPPDRS
jgi:hypothetical protein